MICGIDEAGRGPVIGPLVIAGVSIEKRDFGDLAYLGVKDSKKLKPLERNDLYGKIRKLASCHIIKIQARELDTMMSQRSLNQIEAKMFAQVIENLRPEKAYIDSADISCRNFENMIRRYFREPLSLVVEHKADERYPVVSAASIVAKVERDKEINKLHLIHGDFGSGYSSDEKTRNFLESFFKEKRSFPECVRTKWKTTIRLSNLKLEEFY